MKITDKVVSDLLVTNEIIQRDAVEDPEGYDGTATITRISQFTEELNRVIGRHNYLHEEFSPENVVKYLGDVKDADGEDSHMLCCLLNCLLYLGHQDVVEAYHEASNRQDPECKDVVSRKFRVRFDTGAPVVTKDTLDDAVAEATVLAAKHKDSTFLVTHSVETVVDSVTWNELEKIRKLEADDDE